MSTGAGFNVAQLFANRDFQNLLAGIATGLDPEGIGGALGRTTTALNQAQAAAQTAEQSTAGRPAQQSPEMRTRDDALARSYLLGSMTPQGQVGLNGFKAGPNGNVILDYQVLDAKSPLVAPAPAPPPSATPETRTSAPSAPTAPTAPTAPAAPAVQTTPLVPAPTPAPTQAPPTVPAPQTQTPALTPSARTARADEIRRILPFFSAPRA